MTEERWRIINADCRVALREIADCSIDAIVTDPPYELGFMGKAWDATGIAYSQDVWRECLRVLKHGGHLLAFGGSRTYHRLVCAIEDVGFEIRDQIMWVYGSGFPKSLDVAKAIDKTSGIWRGRAGSVISANGSMTGANYQRTSKGDAVTEDACRWQGWGTALKPAHEPIVLARKALDGTVAQNVLWYGTGALNIDATRIPFGDEQINLSRKQRQQQFEGGIDFGAGRLIGTEINTYKEGGRWPANFIHDGSDEVLELFPETQTWAAKQPKNYETISIFGVGGRNFIEANSGSAARFFYCAKANKTDRNEGIAKQSNFHPTVKPTMLMRYLCRLITPPEGLVLDPFTGSGSTGKAAMLEGFKFIGIEQQEEYVRLAEARIRHAESNSE